MVRNLFLASCMLGANIAFALEVYVSPTGSDSNKGSKDSPVKTILQAQQLVKYKKDPIKIVHINDGLYIEKNSVYLDSKSNGVTYRAVNAGKAQIIGGQYIPADKFTKITDMDIYERLPKEVRDKVVEVDLAALGIKHTKLAKNVIKGTEGLVDLYFEGERQRIARWPNNEYTTMKKVLVNGDYHKKTAGEFEYRDNRTANWLKAVENGDLYLQGFWRTPWTCETVKVAKIDLNKRSITQAEGLWGGGIGSKYAKVVNGVREGDGKERYFAFNLPEELDVAGEWYINHKTQKLYFYPPKELNDTSVLLSDLDTPVLWLKNCENITIENLVIEGGLKDAIRLENATNSKVAGCIVRKTGGVGINVVNGKDSIIQSCDLYNIGAGAITVSAGDKKTLTPANHKIINNKMYDFGQVATISNAMTVNGVGIYVAHNEMFRGNYGGVTFGGNDHIFEYNELYHFGLDGGDYGLFYATSDWASAGSIVRYNFGHHILEGHLFYPDDGKSNETAQYNIAYKTGSGLFAGGGHNNKFLDNVVYQSRVGLHIDSRGIPRKYDENSIVHIRYYKQFAKDNPIYTNKYKGIDKLPYDNPTYPTGNIISDNFVIDCPVELRLHGNKEHFAEVTTENNLFSKKNIGFKNPAKLDFTISDESICDGRLAWINREFPKIGLYKDEYRKVLIDNPERYEFKEIVNEFNSLSDTDASNRIEKK